MTAGMFIWTVSLHLLSFLSVQCDVHINSEIRPATCTSVTADGEARDIHVVVTENFKTTDISVIANVKTTDIYVIANVKITDKRGMTNCTTDITRSTRTRSLRIT